MLNEMGINVVETEEAESEEATEKAADEHDDEDDEAEAARWSRSKPKSLATTEKKEPSERTDDPVRMYLREMGSVELLSREGEIAIAKRIEAGREAMIAGLCESPLTLPGHHHLARRIERRQSFPARHHRSGSDLRRPRRAEDAGAGDDRPDGKPMRAVAGRAGSRRAASAGRAAAAAAAAPPPRRSSRRGEAATARRGDPPSRRSDYDEDDMENSLSLAAIEAELKPKVVETFDNIADAFKRLRRLQEQDIEFRLQEPVAVAGAGAQIQEAQGRDHRRGEVAAPQSGAHRFTGRAALRHQQAPRV